MHTILVSGASTIIGYGILKSIRQAHPDYRLIGISVNEDSAAQAFCDLFIKAPLTKDESYIFWLVNIIQKHNVSLAIPGFELDVLTWSERFSDIERCGAKFLLNNAKLIQLCADKWLFYSYLADKQSPYAIPTTLAYDKEIHEFPLLLKPRRGSGSKGITIVNNINELKDGIGDLGDTMMIQPVVGDDDNEFTTAGFFGFDSQLLAHITLKRKLSNFGFTESAEVVNLKGIERAIKEMAEIFKPVGPTNFQFRVEGSQLKLLEINPRISSTTSIRTAFGFNESALAIKLYLEENPPQQPLIKFGRAYRYVEDLIYYDCTDL